MRAPTESKLCAGTLQSTPMRGTVLYTTGRYFFVLERMTDAPLEH